MTKNNLISIEKARDFVHLHGVMWERALWDYLFDNGSLERVHQCLLCYKNDDGGWGHGLEHDVKSPLSNPLMLEFLLTICRDTRLPIGNILDGAPEWVEKNQAENGVLQNPPTLLEYPHAPWWKSGQESPDSITGNMIFLNICPRNVADRTKQWVLKNITVEKIRSCNWLFMAYHAHDYFLNVHDFPDLCSYKSEVLGNIYKCTKLHLEKGEMEKLLSLFQFANSPNSVVAREAPAGLVDRVLDYLQSSQREDGGWDDEHGLKYWQPYFSTIALLALKNFGRL